MPLDGLQLDRYRLLHVLGMGGMGEVYLAEDTRIARQVALKVMRGSGEPSPGHEDAHRLFLREAKAIAGLQHPGILPLFDYGEMVINGGLLSYMVMPYCQEGSLAGWFQKEDRVRVLSLQQIAHIVEQAADALQYAHERQIVHQDVKLSNFLIRRWRTPGIPDLFLADFGIAKVLSAHSHTSHTIRGTPTAMAPEQWEGHPVAATDQYALAVMIYHLLTGTLPFQGGPGQMMYQHLMVPPPSPSTYRREIPASVDAIVLRALMKKPQERFATILEFAHAFQQALNRLPESQDEGKNGDEIDFSVNLALRREEASTGTHKTLTLANGRNIQLVIPAGVQNGQTLRVAMSHEHRDTQVPVQTVAVTILVLPPEQASALQFSLDETATQMASTIMHNTQMALPVTPIPATIADPAPVFSREELIRSSERARNQGQKGINGKRLLMIVLVLVVIAGSTGLIMYFARSRATTRDSGKTSMIALSPPVSTAALQSTTQGKGSVQTLGPTATKEGPSLAETIPSPGPTATKEGPSLAETIPSPGPTATAQMVSSNPYPPFTGTLVLDDPLDSNVKGYSWEEGMRDQGTCTFTEGAYYANIPLGGYFHSCLALSTQMSDFAFEAQIHLVSGTAGGLVFRADRATTHLYYFTVDRNGEYLLKVYYDKIGGATVKASGSGVAFNGSGVIGVVAQGTSIGLYVNRQLVQQVNDGSFLQGQVGMVVYQGEALFRNARAWVL